MEKITLDMLTKDSVSVLRQQFLTFNGEKTAGRRQHPQRIHERQIRQRTVEKGSP